MSSFEKIILNWYSENRRDLPWRDSTPWGVMVSEFMLQQTPVIRVLPKWNEWMKRWPTPADLAAASTAEVITAWGRLGYPRRALRLHESAKIIAADYNGKVPESIDRLRALPGVGDYTAAAIAAFAFNARTLVLDINIRRLFCRVIDGMDSPKPALSKLEQVARSQLIPEQDAHMWAAATMEFGALVCTSRNPHCVECPLSALCQWKAAGYPPSQLPRKAQSWHGTDRQCRGIIVQALRENQFLDRKEIHKLWHDESQIERALTTLIEDGLISHDHRARYSLPHSP